MIEEKYTDMPLTDEQASLLGFKSLSEPEQYIQVKDVRYTLDEFNRIGDYLLGRNFQKHKELAEKVREYALDVVDPIPAPEGAAFDYWIDGWKDCQASIRGLVKDLNWVPSLTDDQQVVLDWLKEVNKRTTRSTPFGTIYGVINSYEAFIRVKLSKEEQFQVLAAFAEWGMKEVAE